MNLAALTELHAELIAAAQGRAKDVAAQFGVSASYVYALRKNSSLWGDGR